MKILLTGSSSFTGYWFAKTLYNAGAELVLPLRGRLEDYQGVRAMRVAELGTVGAVHPAVEFGDDDFLALLREEKPEALCHHGAQVGDYRSPDYDPLAAAAANTRSMSVVVAALADWGGRLVITGSVFEGGEGAGELPLRAFSPYGLSKSISADIATYWCRQHRLPFGKFVIPNPFGPFEEPRFCAYLMRTWRAGEIADVQTPYYVRDNIHVDLLALAYADFVIRPPLERETRLCPSGYVETQGAFAARFARELGERLRIQTPLRFIDQVEFAEPVTRINTDRVDHLALGWSERRAWDGLAEYYRSA